MKWVGPVLLTKALVRGDTVVNGENIHFIKPVKQRVTTNGLERKLRFSPFSGKLTSLERKHFEGQLWDDKAKAFENRNGYWTGALAEHFDKDYLVECEIPSYWLQKSLPPEIMDPPAPPKKTPTSQKRKRKEGNEHMPTFDTPPGRNKRARKVPTGSGETTTSK